MSFHVKCLKGYGDITFVIVSSHGAALGWCPVSGKGNCAVCDVVPILIANKTLQVTRKQKVEK